MSWLDSGVLAGATLLSLVAAVYAFRGDWRRATLLQCLSLVGLAVLHQVFLRLGAAAWSDADPLTDVELARSSLSLWRSRADSCLLALLPVNLVLVAALPSLRRWREWRPDLRLLGVLGAALTPLLWADPPCTYLSLGAWPRVAIYAVAGGFLVGMRAALPLAGVAWLAGFVAVERFLLLEQTQPRLHCLGGGTLADPALTCAGYAIVFREVAWSSLALGAGFALGAAAVWRPRTLGAHLLLLALFLVLSLPLWTADLALAPCDAERLLGDLEPAALPR